MVALPLAGQVQATSAAAVITRQCPPSLFRTLWADVTCAVSKLAGAERPPQFRNFAKELDHASRADRTLES